MPVAQKITSQKDCLFEYAKGALFRTCLNNIINYIVAQMSRIEIFFNHIFT